MTQRDNISDLKLNFSSLSDVGLVREENQDYSGYAVEDWGSLFVVADGFGDIEGGKQASTKVVDELLEQFRKGHPADPVNFVREALLVINEDTFSLKTEKFGNRMMGSTCACVHIEGQTAYVTNAGDSRVYLVRNGETVQLSRDHSLVQDMVDRGIIDREEAANHPGRNILTEAIGSHPNLNVYCCENPVTLVAGDRIIICSDGLWGLVEEDQMVNLVENNDPQDAVKKLIKAARKNGGHDNITALVIHVAGSS